MEGMLLVLGTASQALESGVALTHLPFINYVAETGHDSICSI